MDQVFARAEPALDVGPRRGRMALEHLARRLHRLRDERAVALEVGEAQQRCAALPLAQILAGPAQLEIALRDLEAISAFIDDLQPVARGLRQRFAEKQDAHTLVRATADAPAQ